MHEPQADAALLASMHPRHMMHFAHTVAKRVATPALAHVRGTMTALLGKMNRQAKVFDQGIQR